MSTTPYYVVDDDEDEIQIVGVKKVNPKAIDGLQLGAYRLDAKVIDITTPYVDPLPPPIARSVTAETDVSSRYSSGESFSAASACGESASASDSESTPDPTGTQAILSPQSVQAPVQAPIQAPIQAPYQAPIQAPIQSRVPSSGPTADTWTKVACKNIFSVLIGAMHSDIPPGFADLPPSFFSDLANTLLLYFPYERFAAKNKCTIQDVNYALISYVIAPLIQRQSADAPLIQSPDTPVIQLSHHEPESKSESESGSEFEFGSEAESESKPQPSAVEQPSSIKVELEQDRQREAQDPAPRAIPCPLTDEETLAYAQTLLTNIAESSFGDNVKVAEESPAPDATTTKGTPAREGRQQELLKTDTEGVQVPQAQQESPIPPPSSSPTLALESPEHPSEATDATDHRKSPKRPIQVTDAEDSAGEDIHHTPHRSWKRREDTPRPHPRKRVRFSSPLSSPIKERPKDHFPEFVPLTDKTRVKRHRVTVDPFGHYESVSDHEDNPRMAQFLLSQGLPLSKQPRNKRPLTARDHEKIKSARKNLLNYIMQLKLEHLDRLGLPHPPTRGPFVDEGDEEAEVPEDFVDDEDEYDDC